MEKDSRSDYYGNIKTKNTSAPKAINLLVRILITDGVQGLPCEDSQRFVNTSKASLALQEQTSPNSYFNSSDVERGSDALL